MMTLMKKIKVMMMRTNLHCDEATVIMLQVA